MKRTLSLILCICLALSAGCTPKANPQTIPIVNPGQKDDPDNPGGSEDDPRTPQDPEEAPFPDPEPKDFYIYGKVTDASSGKGIAGVCVSDGVQIAVTNDKGQYCLVPDISLAKNVFVIMPSGYEFSFNSYGGWADYRPIDSSASRKQLVNFPLTARKDATKCRLLLLGDPQQMSSRPHSGESWKYVCNAISKYRGGVSVPLYQISLGDMVTNEIEVKGKAEAYLDVQKTSGVGSFSVPGNHDHVQSASTYAESVAGFNKWFGPYNYAFNVAGVHCIFLDSCAWCEGGDSKYGEFFNEEAINFLEKDLALVSKDIPVLIFTHCPQTKKHGGMISTPKNSDRLFAALSGRNVDMWYGHIHFGVNYSYTASELNRYAPGVKSLNSHLVSRCGGCWACSGEVCRDGAPRGFVELDIDNGKMHWQFHSIDDNYPQTMNTQVPGQFKGENLTGIKDGVLYCNVYMWDNLWSTPEIWVGGKKVATMAKCLYGSYDASYDPLYSHFYPIWKNAGKMKQRDEPAKEYDNSHLFEYAPGKDVKSVQIRVTDRWGETFTRDVKW